MLPLLYSIITRGNVVSVNVAMESIFSVRCVCLAQISFCLFSDFFF